MKKYLKIFLSSFLMFFGSFIVGYSQFDGYYVQHFNSENGLPNSIKGISYDTKGYVWLGTESGLVRFDGTNFRRYDRSEENHSVTRITFIGITSYGRIYAKADDNMFYYVGKENRLRAVPPAELFKNDTNFHFLPETAAKLYNVCRQKVFRKEAGTWIMPSLKKISRTYATSVGCSKGFFYYLNEKDELIMADTTLNGFWRPVLAGSHKSPARNKDNNRASSVFQTNDQVYLRLEEYIYKVKPSQNKDSISLTPLLPVGQITNIMGILPFRDNETFIIGTLNDGIYVYRKQSFSSLLQNDQEENIYYALSPWGSDGVLTNKGVLAPGKFIPLGSIFDNRSILKATDSTYFIYKRQVNDLGIVHLDATLQTIHFTPSNGNLVRCFKQLEDGSIWLCADSLFLGKVEKDSIQWIGKPKNFPASLNVTTFLEIGHNIFWVGGDKGMAKVNLSTAEVTVIRELENINVRAFYKDERGIIWICTYGNGIYALQDNRLISLPLDKEHYLEYAHTILPDKSGYWWITTNHGLFQVRQDDLHSYLDVGKTVPYYYYYNNTAGFLTNEFNGGCDPAGIVLGNGKFSFPSLKGLVQFFPDSLHPVFPDADIHIDDVLADTTVVYTKNGIYNVPQKTASLQVFISSPYFGNPYNQRLQYKVDESIDVWHDITDNKIELNNFKNGKHRIWIRKQAGFGINNLITKEIVFFAPPGFYQTVVFKIILATLLVLTVCILFKLRTEMLVRQKKKLQQEVLAITREQDLLINDLELTVEQLEKSQSDLQKTAQFKQILALIVAHDLQSPLRFLADAMERWHEKNKQRQEPDLTELSNELKNTSGKLHHFVEEFVTWIKKANMDVSLDAIPVNISELLMELKIFFTELSKERQNKIVIQAPGELFVHTDLQILKLMLRNIIDNANKHTINGTILIEAFAETNTTSIRVTDTGSGMTPEVLQKLTSRMQNPSLSAFNASDGMGFGYKFIIDFCRLADITVKIASEPNKGTRVILSGFKVVAGPQS